ncbi:MAG: hypothetical protein OEY52_00130 [Gammaproteobacteria bacterium]|nr:hypothetical protein [Gammaproteobacteria bacterium]
MANLTPTGPAAKSRRITPNKLLSYGLVCIMILMAQSPAFAGKREQAKRIHDLLVGAAPSNTLLDSMATAVGDAADPPIANLINAANLALADAESKKVFANVTLKNFASPWTNEAQSVFEPLNDYSATVAGMIINDDDFREVLFGNYIYTGGNSAGTPYSPNNNAHYIALENQNIDLSTSLEKTTQTIAAPAGIMTTRAAARAYFIDGTNRAMLRFTFLNHLCYDMEQLKDNTRPMDRIRQDVSRSPGGDSRLFMNNCGACHAGMDPLAQAYARYQWEYTDQEDNGVLAYTADSIQPKYHINSNNFKGGYVTEDDNWTNYWRRGSNVWLGWGQNTPHHADYALIALDTTNDSPEVNVSHGTGAKSLGVELAHSDAFARCQVKKVFKTVCMRNPQNNTQSGEDDTNAFNNMVANFKGAYGYRLKNVFVEAAAYCSGPSTL